MTGHTGHLPSCRCGDRQAEAVAAMVTRGVNQIEASRIVYGVGPVLGSPPEVVRAWALQVVGDLTAGMRKRWGLS